MIFQKQFILTFFPTVLKCPKIAGANSLFFKIAGAKAPMLNTPLYHKCVLYKRNIVSLLSQQFCVITSVKFCVINISRCQA